MTAAETVLHFKDMGVLDRIVVSNAGKVLCILASGWEAYATRSMRDFKKLPGYYVSQEGIDGVTEDGVFVVMMFKP